MKRKKEPDAMKKKFAEIFMAIYAKDNAKAGRMLECLKLDRADKYAQAYADSVAAMLKAREANGGRYFISSIGETRQDFVKARELLQETRRAHVLGEADAGYIAAWLDYLETVIESGRLPSRRESDGEGRKEYPGEEPGEEETSDSL
ncbi:MAG: hypothetical protein JTT11_00870 [Candidatus Brockarchaeota archaeon]|nr:hypothetical protein [Candidatus Brockarchaeota archaeon]